MSVQIDPFSNYYIKLYQNEQYKHLSTDEKSKLFNLIKENLETISNQLNINQLEFNEDGKIKKLTVDATGEVSNKIKDLQEFTKFVSQYFAANPLNDFSQMRVMQTSLEAARKELERSQEKASAEELKKASTSMTTVKETGTAQAPGKTIINEETKKLQNELAKEKRKNGLFIEVGTTIFGTGCFLLVGSFVVAFMFPPAFLAVLLTGLGLMAMGAVVTAPGADLEKREEKILSQIDEQEGFRKHYAEPQFYEFIKRFPNEGESFLMDLNRYANFHRLYDQDKALKNYLEKLLQEKDQEKRVALEKEIVSVQRSINELRSEIGLRPENF